MKQTARNAITFSSTFLFFSSHNANVEKIKKSLQANTQRQTVMDRHRTTEKNNEPLTAPWQKSGFGGYIKFSASNKLLWWLDSFVLLSPLLRQAAKRYR